jgi:hypothetical protein
MKRAFLRDSYDLVKCFLIHALRDLGSWAVHPMLTEGPSIFGPAEIARYEKLVGAPIISCEVLRRVPDRSSYFRCCMDHEGPLLLEPNTGFRLRNSNSVDHLHQVDLVTIVNHRRSDNLVMIYDQSLSYSVNREVALQQKLSELAAAHLSAMAYLSHACFIFVSGEAQVIELTRDLLVVAGLPEQRLISAPEETAW